jgi:hypothetical protein
VICLKIKKKKMHLQAFFERHSIVLRQSFATTHRIAMGCGNSKTTTQGTKCSKGAGNAATQKAEDHSNAAGPSEGRNLSSPQRRVVERSEVAKRSEASALKTRIECKTARIEQLMLTADRSEL